MPSLNKEERNELIDILAGAPTLQSKGGRESLLFLAGLDEVGNRVDLSGAPQQALTNLLKELESYGTVEEESEALGIFLNQAKELFGKRDAKRAFIEELVKRYRLLPPPKEQPPISDWRGVSEPGEVLEKIIGEDTLRPIAFLQRGIEVSRAVALIECPKWVGTGFLISPRLLITNNHVIPDGETFESAVFRFNYQLTFDGASEKFVDYRGQESGLFHTNKRLDYTVVELAGDPGKQWSFAPLASGPPEVNSRVNIIQHPAGRPKQISFQNNLVEYVDATKVQYVTSTLPGSSGSPVFNDAWQVVAVHHASVQQIEPVTNRIIHRNEGISIAAILGDLPAQIKRSL